MRPMRGMTADMLGELGIGLHVLARQVLPGDSLRQRALRIDVPAEVERADHAIQVARLGEQVKKDTWRIARIGRAQLDPSA